MRPVSHDKRHSWYAAQGWRDAKIPRVLLLVLLALALAPTLRIRAGPAAPIVVALTQPDGTTFDAMGFGDEWGSGYETEQGYTVVQDERTGVWRYAIIDRIGSLVPGQLHAGQDPPEGFSRHLRRAAIRTLPIPGAADGTSPASSRISARAAHPALVILVQFSDRASVGTAPAQWRNSFFGSADSVADYYQEVSYGQLTLVPARETHGATDDGIIGWLTLNRLHPDTRADTGNQNRQLARDAIVAADPYVDYSRFDADGNGYISSSELHITVIAAGYETSYGGASASCTPGIWGHQWSLGGAYQGVAVDAPTADGKVVAEYSKGGSYTEFGEQHCSNADSPGHMATIGIMVHEMGHELGWPDLYDTDFSSQGIGIWSVMSYGSWLKTVGYAGSVPAHPDAWSKWYQGWLTPHLVSGVETGAPLPEVESYPRVNQLRNNPGGVDWIFNQHAGSGEYFLIENRQKTGYDAGLPGCGLLIWHVDESRTSDVAANAADSRRLVCLEEADGLRELDSNASQGDAGDPYPGLGANLAFNDSSNPDSRLYSGAKSDVSVARISDTCAATMSADYSAHGSTPDIRVAPAHLRVGLLTDQLVTRVVTIGNFGSGPLIFAIREESAPALTVQPALKITGSAGPVALSVSHPTAESAPGSDVAWLSESPAAGTVSAGRNQDIAVTIDSTGLPTGTFGANLIIDSNDPDASPTTVRVMLRVSLQPLPEIEVAPDALTVTVRPGQSTTRSLTLANTGSGSLTFTVTDREGTREHPVLAPMRADSAPGHGAGLNMRRVSGSLPEPAYYSVSGSPVALRVLVYSDDPRQSAGSTFVDRALQGLGFPYTGYYREPSAFAAALVSSDWDAVIVSHELEYGLGNHWPVLERYFSQGGRLVISTFDIDGSDSVSTTLWQTLGIRHSSDMGVPATLYPWDRSHPLWSGIPILAAWDQLFADEGDRVSSLAGSVSIGGFSPAPSAGQSALVVHGSGRAIVNSVIIDELRADQDSDGIVDGIEVWRNEVAYILGPGMDTRWLSATPTSGILPPGGVLAITVAIDAAGLAEGTYAAELLIESNAFGTPIVAVPITLHVTDAPAAWRVYLPASLRSAQ